MMSMQRALQMGEEASLDVVLISNGNPPVCRLMDASKQKFQLEKADREQKRKQREAR